MAIAPTNTTNLQFAIEFGESTVWQDSARTTSATTNDPIGAIDDQSGNALHATQTTTASKPILGTESFEFDGSNDFLILDSAVSYVENKSDFTLYLAVDLSGSYGSTYHTIASAGITTADSPSWSVYNYGSSDVWRVHLRTSEAVNHWSGDAMVVPTGKQVVIIQGTSTGISVWQDGVNSFEAEYFGGTMGLTVFSLGTQRRGSSTRFIEMNLYGAYLYSEAHDSTERADVTSDLETMMGIGSSPQTISPDATSLTFTVEQPTTSAGNSTVSTDESTLTFTVEQLSVDSSVTTNPDATNLTFSVEQPSVSNAVTVSPDETNLTFNIEQPTISAGNATISLDENALTFTVEQLSVDSSASVSPDEIGIAFTVEQPTVSTSASNETISPDENTLTFTVEQLVVSSGVASVAPDESVLTFTVQQPTLGIVGNWTTEQTIVSEWIGENEVSSSWSTEQTIVSEWIGENTIS